MTEQPDSNAAGFRWAFVAVLLFAGWQTLYLGISFARNPATRFSALESDRNNHYALAVRLAQDIQSADLVGFLRDVEATHSQWPPLHGLLLAPILAVVGPNHAFAPAVSLAAFAGTILLVFLLVARLAPEGGLWGGLLAALFVGLSPAFRIFAADIMLESLGACLTLLCIWSYVRWRQDPTPAAARLVALGLTLLFLEKYNYWLLMLLGLGLCETIARRRQMVEGLRAAAGASALRAWFVRQVFHPLNWLVIGYAALLAYAAKFGPIDVGVGRFSFRFSATGHMAVYVLYLLALARLCWDWRREAGPLLAAAPSEFQMLARWHVAPVMVWFLLPGRLLYFLWYNSTSNTPVPGANFIRQAAAYRDFIVADYFAAPWVAALAAGLATLGILVALRRRGVGLAVAAIFLLAVALTIKHPAVRSRHVHSWLPIGWALAGVGFAAIAAAARRAGALGAAVPALAVAGLALGQSHAFTALGRSPERGHFPGPSYLPLTDAAVAAVDPAEPAALFATLRIEAALEWRYRELRPRHPVPELRVRKFADDPARNRAAFQRWLETTPARTVVLVDVADSSPFYFAEVLAYRQFRDLLAAQSRFTAVETRPLPGLGAAVTVYRRADVVAAPPRPSLVR